jgi:hypothetical protein
MLAGAGFKPASRTPTTRVVGASIPRGIGTGSIAEAFYGEVPAEIIEEVHRRTPAKLWSVIEQFSSKFAGQTGQPRTGA